MCKIKTIIPACLLALLVACGSGDGTRGSTVAPSSAEGTASPSPTDEGHDRQVPDPAHIWEMNSTGSPSTGGIELVLKGDFEAGPEAISFDGATGYATTSGAGPVATTESFSVAVWAYPAGTQPFMTAASQIGEVAGAFYLGYGEDSWAFSMKSNDSNAPGNTIRATSRPLEPEPEWVHLVGVFDADLSELRLYVDGQREGVASFDVAWEAKGPFVVGTAQANEVLADFWVGAIGDVRLYASALSDSQIALSYDSEKPSSEPPPMTESGVEAAFRIARNEICQHGSAETAVINDTVTDAEGATPAQIAAGLRLVVRQIELAQSALDKLEVPESLAEFVLADNMLRAERLRIFNEGIALFERGDVEKAFALGEELTKLDIATEAGEDAHGLRHCP
jgi:hypothetical protein